MISLKQIESDLVAAMKAKDQLAVETLRGLKTRIQNEKAALKGRPERSEGFLTSDGELSEASINSLIRSEVKRRKEAAQSFIDGGRQEMADKEISEAEILSKYLPAQMSEAQLSEVIEKAIVENNFTAADFGKAMGALKKAVGDSADGALLAKVLKERLK